MIHAPQQLEFPSLAFPKDRTVLYVSEVAAKWRVTDQHVIDLANEGKLMAFDVAGKHEYIRVPMSAIAAISKQTGVPQETLLAIIKASKPERGISRAFLRIPVKEGFEKFMTDNHCLNP